MSPSRRHHRTPGGAAPRASSSAPSRLRGKVWVETGSGVALTDAGADLLEQIEVVGSLSQAARRLRFSYRRAWLLVDAMNRRWPQPLVQLTIGGRRGGGARLTALGGSVLRAYRDLQLRFEHFLDTATPGFHRSTTLERR